MKRVNCYFPKFLTVLGKQYRPKSDFLEEQSGQGLHCLPLNLHLVEALFHGQSSLSEFYILYSKVIGSLNV